MPDGKLTGLEVLLAAFVISVIIFATFFGYLWAAKKWKERRLLKSKSNIIKPHVLTEGK